MVHIVERFFQLFFLSRRKFVLPIFFLGTRRTSVFGEVIVVLYAIKTSFPCQFESGALKGTVWDLSLEDDKAELTRMQNREQPELLVGSPSTDEFSSLLSTRAAREISKLKTEKIEPRIRACVQSYKLQMEMQKHHFVHEHPKDSKSWEIPEVQSLVSDPRVYSIKENDEVLRGDGRWKRDKRFVHITRNPETVSEYPASRVVENVESHQTSDDFRWCDQNWKNAFCRSSAG